MVHCSTLQRFLSWRFQRHLHLCKSSCFYLTLAYSLWSKVWTVAPRQPWFHGLFLLGNWGEEVPHAGGWNHYLWEVWIWLYQSSKLIGNLSSWLDLTSTCRSSFASADSICLRVIQLSKPYRPFNCDHLKFLSHTRPWTCLHISIAHCNFDSSRRKSLQSAPQSCPRWLWPL